VFLLNPRENKDGNAMGAQPNSGASSKLPEFSKHKQLSLKDTGLITPEQQANVQETTFGQTSRNLYQFEDIQKKEMHKMLEQGTVSLNKKLFSLKLKKADISKFKQRFIIMASFICTQLTDVGGVRCVRYTRDREETINHESRVSEYFICNDFND
jgi:hypothetical protein